MKVSFTFSFFLPSSSSFPPNYESLYLLRVIIRVCFFGGVDMLKQIWKSTTVGIKEVQIIQWFVQPGARVEEWDKICEVASDKANVEVLYFPFWG